MKPNLILGTDSYKLAMVKGQYPEGTENISSYVESRGGPYDKTLFFGLQMWIKEFLLNPITKEDIEEAESYIAPHGLPFYRSEWEYILNKHGGYMPVSVSAPKEGSVINTKNVLVQTVNTDKRVPWITTHLETSQLRLWYPITVATFSFEVKKIILDYLRKTSDDPEGQLPFRYHDFGFRGVSSAESAGIGGLSHLVNFKGTDTLEALRFARKFYGEQMAGFSIPAMEHSTVSSHGRNGEVAAFRSMIKEYAKPGAIFAMVSDTYDVFNAAEHIWGEELRPIIVDSGAMAVFRPDSGDPLKVPRRIIAMLDEKFGHTVNSKGYKVLKNVRVIQGDGVNIHTISNILGDLLIDGYSAENISFGAGGTMLQKDIDRDVFKFAFKCSAAKVNGVWREVYKDPITDPGKRSKTGILSLHNKPDGQYETLHTWSQQEGFVEQTGDLLEEVYRDGRLLREQSLSDIRALAHEAALRG